MALSFLENYGYHFSQMCRIIRGYFFIYGRTYGFHLQQHELELGLTFSYMGRFMDHISANMGGIMLPNFESEWHVTVQGLA